VIAALIDAFVTDADERLEWARAGAREHGFLPLYLGWITAIGVRPDGSFVTWDHDTTGEVRACTDAYLQRMALCQGAKKWPELAELIPTRPPEAIDCATCRGTGVPIPSMPQVICECGGVGWCIPGELHAAFAG
jgi:hypothetical protein